VAAGLAAAHEAYAPLAYAGNRIQLKDCTLKRALGVGTFGKVWLALYNDAPFALKQIAKSQVVKKGLVAHVKRERDVMKECADTPFAVRLTASFQDDQCLYLLMEVVPGGELFYYLQSLTQPLSEPHARFYAACVCEAFAFLHSRFYVYRDLKPENLLLCANGYLKVADFSFVKRLRGGKTHTLCGTPAYLAPEQIQRVGHDRAVDWWALGVLVYELLAGVSPFYHDDDMTMYRRIVDCKHVSLPRGGSAACSAARAAIDELMHPCARRFSGTPSCRRLAQRCHLKPRSWCDTHRRAPRIRARSQRTNDPYVRTSQINGLLQKAPHQRLPMSRRGVAEIADHKFFKVRLRGAAGAHIAPI
jgi:cGMP-dependent protein kinase